MRALVLLSLLIGCSSGSTDDVDTVDGPVRWFTGTLEVFDTTSTYLVERTSNEATGVVAERVMYDASPEPVSFRAVYELDDGDKTFSLSFNDGFGTFEGDGSFEGPRFAWTAWTYDVAYVDGPFAGSRLYAENRLTDDDRYVSNQEVRSPEGFKEAEQKVRLVEVDEAAWQAARDAITGE